MANKIGEWQNGDVLNADDLNDGFARMLAQDIKVMMCSGLANNCYENIDRDIFADSDGTYNTVCTSNCMDDTNSYYCSADSKYYSKFERNACCVDCTTTSAGTTHQNDKYIYLNGGSYGCRYNDYTTSFCNLCLNCYDKTEIDICQCIYVSTSGHAAHANVTISPNLFSCCLCCSSNGWYGDLNNITLCKVSDHCFDVYLNSSCICQISESQFDMSRDIKQYDNYSVHSCISFDICQTTGSTTTQIVTEPRTFSCCPEYTVLTYKGTVADSQCIRYDVFDASNDNKIGCDLIPNKIQYLTDDCANSLYLNIKQCSSCDTEYSSLENYGYYVGRDDDEN